MKRQELRPKSTSRPIVDIPLAKVGGEDKCEQRVGKKRQNQEKG